VFRHLYTHSIDPGRIFSLMASLEKTWLLVRQELEAFLGFLESSHG
jgi:hypothetical protein